jgi:hypothetical protein
MAQLNTPLQHSPTSFAPLYLTLLSALNAGWKVQEPIVLYPDDSSAQQHTYHFVLRAPASARQWKTCSVVAAPQCPQVERFIQQMGWRVV